MNRRTKFDAASCILGGEIRIRTNTHKHTVNDISAVHTLPIGMSYRHVWIITCRSIFEQINIYYTVEHFTDCI